MEPSSLDDIICATKWIVTCSAEDRFRQANFFQVLLHQTDILMALQRLLGCLERNLGGVLQKNFAILGSEELKYISVIFVTNKDVLLCFYFYR